MYRGVDGGNYLYVNKPLLPLPFRRIHQPAEVVDKPDELFHRMVFQIVAHVVPVTREVGTLKESTRLTERCRDALLIFVPCLVRIPGQLFESELFGHEPGAFTGARSARPGKFELANHGTLFLDEIGELDMALQSKLLRALQDFRIVRLGGVDEREFNVRLICGTNRNLEDEVKRGNFRSDLYYRINVIHIEMPTLRSRREDIPLLFQHFVRLYGNQFGRRPEPISTSAIRILEKYHWPGNMRELENLAKRFVVLGRKPDALCYLLD